MDVAAAITRGLRAGTAARHALFTEASVAAAIEAENLGIGPLPLGLLGRLVRAGGIAAALQLPEPLIGDEPAALARQWLKAAHTAGTEISVDEEFGRWLGMVAALIAVRRSARRS